MNVSLDCCLTPLATTRYMAEIRLIFELFSPFGSNLARMARTDLNLYFAWNKENKGRTRKPRTTKSRNQTQSRKQVASKNKPYFASSSSALAESVVASGVTCPLPALCVNPLVTYLVSSGSKPTPLFLLRASSTPNFLPLSSHRRTPKRKK